MNPRKTQFKKPQGGSFSLGMALVFIFPLFLALGCSSQEHNKREVKWTRTVLDVEILPVEVKENVVVTETDSETTVLMNSSDTALLKTPFTGTVTMHDFRRNLLALKPLRHYLCFVGEVAKSYDEVIKEIELRAQTGYISPTRRRRHMVISDQTLTSTGSEVLDKFCWGRRLIRVIDVDFIDRPCDWWVPVFPPMLCFWVPVQIWIDQKEEAEILKIEDA